jgi:hypothetical protein
MSHTPGPLTMPGIGDGPLTVDPHTEARSGARANAPLHVGVRASTSVVANGSALEAELRSWRNADSTR